MCVDAIVNTANPRPVIGLGTDSQIHEKAGPKLLAARQKIGSMDIGCAPLPGIHIQTDGKSVDELCGEVLNQMYEWY